VRRREDCDGAGLGLQSDRAMADLLRGCGSSGRVGPVRLVVEPDPRHGFARWITGQAGVVEQGTGVLLRLDNRPHMDQVTASVEREAEFP